MGRGGKKCQIASFNVYKISKIRKYLTLDACKTLMQSLVVSHLDYANSILINLPNKTIAPLERIQRMAARITLGKHKRYDAMKAFKELHWLPIKKRIEYKVCLMVYKCLIGEAPTYLSNMLTLEVENGQDTRRRSKVNFRVPKTKNKSKLADRAFSVAGPKLFNSLPDELKEAKSTEIFKKQLKTYLCQQAFEQDQ